MHHLRELVKQLNQDMHCLSPHKLACIKIVGPMSSKKEASAGAEAEYAGGKVRADMKDGERKAAEPNFIKVGWQPYRGDKNELTSNLLGYFITIKEYEFLQWAKAHYKTHSQGSKVLASMVEGAGPFQVNKRVKTVSRTLKNYSNRTYP